MKHNFKRHKWHIRFLCQFSHRWKILEEFKFFSVALIDSTRLRETHVRNGVHILLVSRKSGEGFCCLANEFTLR